MDNKQFKAKPDCSQYVTHFTKNGKCTGEHNDDFQEIEEMNALDRFVNILKEKRIRASKMTWTGASAVCFTESPWTSLLSHTERYSPYGIGFTKKRLYKDKGGPALYCRPDIFENQTNNGGFDKSVMPFLTPFSLSGRSRVKYCDYSHEREWRVPKDFCFEYNDIQFIVLNSQNDWNSIPEELKSEIDPSTVIFMDNYKLVEKLWPVHIK